MLDCSTEVLTLRQMTSREFNDRQDASKKQISELKELARHLADLKPAMKATRDRLKQVIAHEDQDTLDLAKIVEEAAGIHSLPVATKFTVLLEDATMLRFMALAVLVGMLFGLCLAVEGFSYFSCRFVCAR